MCIHKRFLLYNFFKTFMEKVEIKNIDLKVNHGFSNVKCVYRKYSWCIPKCTKEQRISIKTEKEAQKTKKSIGKNQ